MIENDGRHIENKRPKKVQKYNLPFFAKD